MLGQEVRYRFSTVKNERAFEFLIAPGTPWEDIYAVLREMVKSLKSFKKK